MWNRNFEIVKFVNKRIIICTSKKCISLYKKKCSCYNWACHNRDKGQNQENGTTEEKNEALMTWSVCDGQNKNSEQTWTSIVFVVESGAWSACDGQKKKLGCLGGVSILCRPVAPAVRSLSQLGMS